MSRFTKRIQNLIKKLDLFPATQFVKYQEQSDYKTATGGCVSITVIVVFLVLFYNLGIKTINQDIIYASVNYKVQLEPPYINVKINKSPDFLFGIGIMGIDLNNPNLKFFNISLWQIYSNPSFQIINTTNIPLVKCSKDHFSANQQIKSLYNKFKVEYALCPEIGSQFVVGGRLTSDVYAQISVFVDYCNQTIDPTCAHPLQFQAYQQALGGFTLFTPVISTIVNAGEKQYKQVFVEDQNFFFFSSQFGIRVSGQIQEYLIETDVSLMPYTEIEPQYVISLPGVLTAKSTPTNGSRYASVVFDKSSLQTTYSRSFNKIDSYFSYVGGLVGTVLLLFFIMSSYSDMSFSIDIANELFLIADKDDATVPTFSFFYFVTCSIQSWISCCSFTKDWKQTNLFKTAAEEMDKQLDISHILKRIYYIQEGLQALLTNSQLETLYLKRKKNIEEVARMRKKLQYNFIVQDKPQQMSPQNKFQDSSIVHIGGSNIQEGKEQIRIQQQQYYQIDINHCQSINQSINEDSEMQQEKEKMKDCLNQVIKDSKGNNQISIRILQKLDPKIMPLSRRNNEE